MVPLKGHRNFSCWGDFCHEGFLSVPKTNIIIWGGSVGRLYKCGIDYCDSIIVVWLRLLWKKNCFRQFVRVIVRSILSYFVSFREFVRRIGKSQLNSSSRTSRLNRWVRVNPSVMEKFIDFGYGFPEMRMYIMFYWDVKSRRRNIPWIKKYFV